MELWDQLQICYAALSSRDLGRQRSKISDLLAFLQDSPAETRFPRRFASQAIRLLQKYCSEILPRLKMSAEDRRWMEGEYQQAIQQLRQQAHDARDVEIRCAEFFSELNTSRRNISLPRLIEKLHAIPAITPVAEDVPPVSDRLKEEWKRFRKASWTISRAVPFFRILFAEALPPSLGKRLPPLQSIFWDQLHDTLHPKAVLVNQLTKQATILRLEVSATLQPSGADTLDVDNQVDARMYNSCWNALLAARQILEMQFSDLLGENALDVRCRFDDPSAEYSDSSASLLIALKIIGDVLGCEIDPDVLVTGEVDENGQVLSVDFLDKKIQAADENSSILRVYAPYDKRFGLPQRVTLKPVGTLEEAVTEYYGEKQLRAARPGFSRRDILGLAAGLLVTPMGSVILRNFFSSPRSQVTQYEWKMLESAEELYKQKSEYRHAAITFEALLDRFQGERSAPEALQLQGQACGHLGRIYMQQQRLSQGFAVYRQALRFWEQLHDRERQADTLMYTGISHIDEALVNDDPRGYRQALACYEQAKSAIHAKMEHKTRLEGNVALWKGVVYYHVDEPEQAKNLVTQGAQHFLDAGAPWNHQLSQQYLGNVLVRLGDFDGAGDLLESALHSPLFQNPFNQSKSLTGLCDLFFSMQKPEEGLDYARRAEALCRDNDLPLQLAALRQVLGRHNVALPPA